MSIGFKLFIQKGVAETDKDICKRYFGYSPIESIRDSIKRFKDTNTFNALEVTNLYVQAELVLQKLDEVEREKASVCRCLPLGRRVKICYGPYHTQRGVLELWNGKVCVLLDAVNVHLEIISPDQFEEVPS